MMWSNKQKSFDLVFHTFNFKCLIDECTYSNVSFIYVKLFIQSFHAFIVKIPFLCQHDLRVVNETPFFCPGDFNDSKTWRRSWMKSNKLKTLFTIFGAF